MTNTQKPLDLIESTILTITQTQRALNESREQYIAQSILTPLPWGTHDAGKVAPLLPVEQARDVIAWHEAHLERCANAMANGVGIIRWIRREEAEYLYPRAPDANL